MSRDDCERGVRASATIVEYVQPRKIYKLGEPIRNGTSERISMQQATPSQPVILNDNTIHS